MTVLLISRKSNFTKGKVTLGCILFIRYLSSTTWIIFFKLHFFEFVCKILPTFENHTWIAVLTLSLKISMVYSCLFYTFLVILHYSIYHLCLVWTIQIALDGYKLFWSGPMSYIMQWNEGQVGPKWLFHEAGKVGRSDATPIKKNSSYGNILGKYW